MTRPPFKLWSHALRDLAKLLGLSTAVLVIVIALGAAIKPLSDGLLDAGDAALFISLAMVPMLAYVLPFAAGFASTLVYHRLGTSNEALAQYASGISHRSVLVPAAIMGLGLALTLGTLNEFVIPRFLREMRHLITVDFARLLSQEVSRGKALRLDDWLIFADRAERIAPAPGSGVREQVVFSRFAAIKLGKGDEPEQEVAATTATMWLYPPGGFPGEAPVSVGTLDHDTSVVVLELEGVSASDATGIGGFRDSSTAVFSVPNVFRDNPKYLSYRELRDLHRVPERMHDIDSRRRELALLMQRDATAQRMLQALQQGTLTLTDERNQPVLLNASLKAWEPASGRIELAPPPGKTAIELFHQRDGDAGRVALHSLAADGELRLQISQDAARKLVLVGIELRAVRTRESASQSTFVNVPERSLLRLGALRLNDQTIDNLASLPARTLLASSASIAEPALVDVAAQRARAESLQRKIDELLREATSKQHERWAMAASCFAVMLTGAISALVLCQKMPLVTYLWTFIPGLISWVTISGGQQLTEQAGGRGLILMWAGVAGLLVYAFIMFLRLRLH